MRQLSIIFSLGMFSMALLLGCGSSDVTPTGEMTADEKAAADREVQTVEDAEMAQQRRTMDRRR